MLTLRQGLSLTDYATIPIAFSAQDIYVMLPLEMGFAFEKQGVSPFIKDYDAPGNTPLDWPKMWDLSNWQILGAYDETALVGAAALAYQSPELVMLEGRDDLAVLWDIRISPSRRGQGVGAFLFDWIENWCAQNRVKELKVETQNINAGACDFYRCMGCHLRSVDSGAYTDLPDEIQLIFSKRIPS